VRSRSRTGRSGSALDVICQGPPNLRYEALPIMGISPCSRGELGGAHIEIRSGEFGMLAHRLTRSNRFVPKGFCRRSLAARRTPGAAQPLRPVPYAARPHFHAESGGTSTSGVQVDHFEQTGRILEECKEKASVPLHESGVTLREDLLEVCISHRRPVKQAPGNEVPYCGSERLSDERFEQEYARPHGEFSRMSSGARI
jgi:hypothetical protein